MRLLRGRMETVPFWACLSASWAGSNAHLAEGTGSRRFTHTFACAVHSHSLGASPLLASRLSPFPPCTPTFENQSPAVGWCFHSSTGRVGVGLATNLRDLTYMDTQLWRFIPSHSSSLSFFANVGFERTGRTTAG